MADNKNDDVPRVDDPEIARRAALQGTNERTDLEKATDLETRALEQGSRGGMQPQPALVETPPVERQTTEDANDEKAEQERQAILAKQREETEGRERETLTARSRQDMLASDKKNAGQKGDA